MSITLYQFNLLQDDEKAEYLWQEGAHIGERFEENASILLYQVHAFYVEVYYDASLNKIERLRSFCNLDQLEPYLEKMTISGIDNIKYDG